ncbi:hypothetical protein AAG747_15315 [Rapidithrix thailandica]|uniref:Uncharacterized protein n=1 Tax=Rapidithrix thailandica TaxID=413964 RepID=A0AAW9S701_9BACT
MKNKQTVQRRKTLVCVISLFVLALAIVVYEFRFFIAWLDGRHIHHIILEALVLKLAFISALVITLLQFFELTKN